MIEGIEVLNKTEIMTISDAGLIWTLILIIGGLIGIVLFLCLTYINENFVIGTIFSILALFSGFVVLAAASESKPTGRYQYEVTIDESVLFDDVFENYDIIEQKGKLWILEDKEK